LILPWEREQVQRLRVLRAKRELGKNNATLSELERRARTEENLLAGDSRAVEELCHGWRNFRRASSGVRRIPGIRRIVIALR